MSSIYLQDTFRKYDILAEFFKGYRASAISQDAFGTLWFALGSSGIVKINNDDVVKIESDTIIDFVPTKSIFFDATGSSWFGTERGMVLYRDGKYFEYASGTALDNNIVNKIIRDREGSVWIATDSAGLHKISPGKFRTNNLGVTVNAIAEDKDGLVWIGTDSGVRCYKGDVEQQNALTEYCKNLRIRHVAVA